MEEKSVWPNFSVDLAENHLPGVGNTGIFSDFKAQNSTMECQNVQN
jgi:hypothetical protein